MKKSTIINTPSIGTGCSIVIGSDRYAAEVVKIFSPKEIGVCENKVKCNDWFAEDWTVYKGEFENPENIQTFTLRKNGAWVMKGQSMRNGICLWWSHVHRLDPSF